MVLVQNLVHLLELCHGGHLDRDSSAVRSIDTVFRPSDPSVVRVDCHKISLADVAKEIAAKLHGLPNVSEGYEGMEEEWEQEQQNWLSQKQGSTLICI